MSASRLPALEARLLGVERELRLLDRAAPTNFWAEVERLASAEVALDDAPRFRYAAAPPNVGGCERELGEVEAVLAQEFGTDEAELGSRERVVARLLHERARELALECRLVGMRAPRVDGALAAKRFAVDGHLLREAHELAAAWLGVGSCGEPTSVAEAFDSEVLLAHELGRLAALAGLPLAIEERSLTTLAAVSERSLLVRTGALVTPAEALRVFVHEVTAHLLPRLRAASEGPPYRVGTRDADADEEGRAILSEERAGVLDAARRRQLGLRHLAAEHVRRGLPFAEARAELEGRGASAREAAEVLCRALRGGGLAREIVYLPGYLRVKSALSVEPQLERELERGRVSIAAARELSAALG